jgi:hypothetical protein
MIVVAVLALTLLLVTVAVCSSSRDGREGAGVETLHGELMDESEWSPDVPLVRVRRRRPHDR